MYDQGRGRWMKFRRLSDREIERFCDREAVVIFSIILRVVLCRRVLLFTEHPHWFGLEAPAVFRERDFELFAISRCLLVGKRQPTKRFR